MARKKTKKSAPNNLIMIIAPLIALVALGASLFVWYRALVPEHERIDVPKPFTVSPEVFSAGLEGNLRLAVSEFGIDGDAVETRPADEFKDEIEHVFEVTIPENLSLAQLNLRLTRMTEEMGGDVIRGYEGKGGDTLSLTLGVGKKATDIVLLKKRRGIVKPSARIAVVIDDLGIKDVDLAKRLCDLGREITLAILPFQRRTDEVIDLADDTDTNYMLHMPMQPKSENVNPGKGALVTTDDRDAVRKKLDRAFRSVPGSKGLNNHMGSLVTENERSMEYVMEYLGEKDYFFLDSRTSTKSVGYSMSQKSGVRGARISGYIDAVNDRDAIAKRLDELAELALANGSAIILGHDRPATVELLERKLPEMEAKGITFVALTDLIH